MTRRRTLATIAALLLTLAGAPAGAEPVRLDLGGAVETALPVTSMAERRFATVVRQQLDFSCGSAALATLLRYHYDRAAAERSVFVGMWDQGDQAQIRQQGFSLLDMKRYLARHGIAADGYRVTLEQIEAAGMPGIALIDVEGYRHFVVVKAVEGDAVLLGDPSLGLRWERRGRFLKHWNGVFFALNVANVAGEVRLGRAADRAAAPRFRFDGHAEPVGAAALRMMRPVTGSF